MGGAAVIARLCWFESSPGHVLKPDIKIEPIESAFRRCYGCNTEAFATLVLGHRDENGRNGNAHAVSFCLTCMKEVARVTADAVETA